MNSDILNIALVDNNQNYLEELKTVLRKMKLTVNLILVQNPLEFQKLIAQGCDLIVCNINANIIDIKTIRQNLQNTEQVLPVLALLSAEQLPKAIQLIQQGASNIALYNMLDFVAYQIYQLSNLQKIKSEYQEASKTIKELKDRSSVLLEKTEEPIGYLLDGAHIYANPAYLGLFGFSTLAELQSYTILDLVSAEDQKKLKVEFKKLKTRKNISSLEMKLQAINPHNQQPFDLDVKLTNSQYQGTPCLQLNVVLPERIVATTAQQTQPSNIINNELNQGYSYNKTAVLNKIRQEKPKSAWFICLVLDGIYKIWRKHGIEAADQFMTSIHEAMVQVLSTTALHFNYADNAILVMIEGSNIQEADRLTNALRNLCENHEFKFKDKILTSSCHGHFISLGNDFDLLDETLRRLDKESALLSSSILSEEDEDKEDDVGSIDELFSFLELALSKQQAKLQFVPIAGFSDYEIERYGVQVSFIQNENNMAPWNRKLVELYDHQALKQLEQWMIVQAIQGIAAVISTSPKQKHIFIPLSAASDENFCLWLADILQKSKLPANYLVFGISEELLTEKPAFTSKTAEKLLEMGCLLYLADYSLNDLGMISRNKFSYVTLDDRFVNRISRTRDQELKLKAQTGISHIREQSLKIIADGVDAPPQMALVWEVNIDFVKGEMISPPLDKMTFDFGTFTI